MRWCQARRVKRSENSLFKERKKVKVERAILTLWVQNHGLLPTRIIISFACTKIFLSVGNMVPMYCDCPIGRFIFLVSIISSWFPKHYSLLLTGCSGNVYLFGTNVMYICWRMLEYQTFLFIQEHNRSLIEYIAEFRASSSSAIWLLFKILSSWIQLVWDILTLTFIIFKSSSFLSIME